VILRPARDDDVEALVDVQQPAAVVAFAHVFPQDTHPFPRAEIVARWREEVADPLVHVYLWTDDADGVQGFAATRGDELLHFGTALDTWGTGEAQQFHAALIDRWRTSDSGSPAQVRLRVLEENHRARRFYEKLGWQATDVRTHSPFAPYPVLIEYRLRLTD
jgi:RimJ/RimL family protein N-acetyltransferase